jgi:hypothetical protein
MRTLAVTVLLPLVALTTLVAAEKFGGVVVDQTGLPLPGVGLELRRGVEVIEVATTAADGTFELRNGVIGDTVRATLDAFEPMTSPAGPAMRIVMELAHATETTEVVASALTSSGAASEHLGSTLAAPLAQRLPTARPRVLQSLSLLPAVMRGPDGLLRIGGTRPHESSLWIDGFDVTDPVMGTTIIDLPLESVKGMAVIRDPISTTFSGALGSLASIETLPGGNAFHGGVQGFIPRPRLSSLGFGRIESFFPRAYLGGGIGRVHYFGSSEMTYERVPVPGVTGRSGRPSTGATGVTTFGRVDVQTSRHNGLTFEGLFAPMRTYSSALSPLRRLETAPQVDTDDRFAGLVDRLVLSGANLLTIRMGVLVHGTELVASGSGVARLTPDGWRQNWFTSLNTTGNRRSLSVMWDHAGSTALGSHTISVTADVRHRAMADNRQYHPISIENVNGVVVRAIQFGDAADFRVGDNLGGFGVRDVWVAGPRLTLEVGGRLDWGSRGAGLTPSPRAGVSYRLDEDGRTVIKGSAGRFVGQVPLLSQAFDHFVARSDTAYDPSFGVLIGTVLQQPQLAPLRLPRAVGLAIDLEHRVRHGLDVQVGARQRDGSALPNVQVPSDSGTVLLASTGTSRYRELQVSVHQMWRENAQVFFSYVRAWSTGEVNDFGTLFGALDTPLLQPAGSATMGSSVPHRLRGWATVGLPHAVVVSPAMEWRTGFPYTYYDIARHYVDPIYGQRFPTYFSLDVTAFKTVSIRERTLDLGLQFFDLTRHFNPRDVYSVVGTPRFGTFTNNLGLTLGGYMQVRW